MMMSGWGSLMMVVMFVFWGAVIWGGVAIARGHFRPRPAVSRADDEIVGGHDRKPPTDPRILVSDDERRAVVEALQRHAHDGRLTVAEFDERCAGAWAARTAGELADITVDLPAIDDP